VQAVSNSMLIKRYARLLVELSRLSPNFRPKKQIRKEKNNLNKLTFLLESWWGYNFQAKNSLGTTKNQQFDPKYLISGACPLETEGNIGKSI